MKKSFFLYSALLAAMCGACFATIMERMDIARLTGESAGCAMGTVSDVRSAWNDSHTKILTYIKIRVDRDLIAEQKQKLGLTPSAKDSLAGKEIVLRELGGVVEGAASYVPGTPKFSKGERVTVFLALHPDDGSCYRTIGMAQGKYTVGKNGDIEKNVSGIAFYDPDEESIKEEAVPLQKSTLNALERKIAEALEKKKEEMKPQTSTNDEE